MRRFPRFEGNCPHNVAKDAKYGVRTGRDGPVVALTYRTVDDERWHATTEEHPELVRMVNEVKVSEGFGPNGSFYINEYRQVIVPTAGADGYRLAGKYERSLCFEFEGTVLTGRPKDLEGNELRRGDRWLGPHPGIPYVLSAGGEDIKYTVEPRPNVEREYKLSQVIGRDAAGVVASGIRAVKGYPGGRFYVNEFRTIFAPVQTGGEWQYVYIGQVDLQSWFPEPNAAGIAEM